MGSARYRRMSKETVKCPVPTSTPMGNSPGFTVAHPNIKYVQDSLAK